MTAKEETVEKCGLTLRSQWIEFVSRRHSAR
jgi:hypothetical protein